MDLWSTTSLNGILRNLIRPQTFLLSRYFGQVKQSPDQTITWDVEVGGRKLAPFCSPAVAGRVIRDQGFRTDTIQPAYVKDKRQFRPEAALSRAIGERIGGSLTPVQRAEAWLATTMADQADRLDRRLEWMASEAIREAALTIEGEDYPARHVDFGRPAALAIDLNTGGTLWSDAAALPLDDLEAWSLLCLERCGALPTEVIMSLDVWRVFRRNAQVKDELTLLARTGQRPLDTGGRAAEGGVVMGAIHGFTVIVYVGWWQDEAGTNHPLWPAGTLAMVAPGAIEGTRYFGAIQDVGADGAGGLQAVEKFSKSWVDQDPSCRWLLMQSAPLAGPRRPDASLRARVLAPA